MKLKKKCIIKTTLPHPHLYLKYHLYLDYSCFGSDFLLNKTMYMQPRKGQGVLTLRVSASVYTVLTLVFFFACIVLLQL